MERMLKLLEKKSFNRPPPHQINGRAIHSRVVIGPCKMGTLAFSVFTLIFQRLSLNSSTQHLTLTLTTASSPGFLVVLLYNNLYYHQYACGPCERRSDFWCRQRQVDFFGIFFFYPSILMLPLTT